jgi:tungstate transport system ATP-binding protein
MSVENLYSLRDLEFSYAPAQRKVLDIPWLTIQEGSFLALAGPNGSGKTSLLKLLNDLLPLGKGGGIASGTAVFRGETYIENGIHRGSRALRNNSIYLHQHPYILTGGFRGNMRFAVHAVPLPRNEKESRVSEALDLLGLGDTAKRRHKGLSGGEAQRLALARLLAVKAEVLLLDEPTASVDAESRDRIVAALSSLARSGTTVIFSSHEPALIDGLAQRVLVFERGTIIEDRERNHAH